MSTDYRKRTIEFNVDGTQTAHIIHKSGTGTFHGTIYVGSRSQDFDHTTVTKLIDETLDGYPSNPITLKYEIHYDSGTSMSFIVTYSVNGVNRWSFTTDSVTAADPVHYLTMKVNHNVGKQKPNPIYLEQLHKLPQKNDRNVFYVPNNRRA